MTHNEYEELNKPKENDECASRGKAHAFNNIIIAVITQLKEANENANQLAYELCESGESEEKHVSIYNAYFNKLIDTLEQSYNEQRSIIMDNSIVPFMNNDLIDAVKKIEAKAFNHIIQIVIDAQSETLKLAKYVQSESIKYRALDNDDKRRYFLQDNLFQN